MRPEEIEIRIIGKRAGEKLYEELMTEEEAMNAYDEVEMLVVPRNCNRDDWRRLI